MTILGRRALAFAALSVAAIGCSQPLTASPPAQALRGEAIDPEFTLVNTSPKATWRVEEAIVVQAELAYRGALPELTIGGSGGGLIGFSVRELGGDRRMDAVREADCSFFTISPGQPITSSYRKSGTIDPGEPNEGFYRQFFADPLFHLPAGSWQVEAWAQLNVGPECRGRTVDLRASLLIIVQ